MAEPGERQRTILRAPRVEFDLSALALGACGYLFYQWSWYLLAALLDVQDSGPVRAWQGLRFEFFRRIFDWIGMPFTGFIQTWVGATPIVVVSNERLTESSINQSAWRDLPGWKLAIVGAFIFLLWSLVAGAISRVYAVRIARDESIGAGSAFAFSVENLRSFVLAPLFVAAATAFFLGVAALAGVLSGIPAAGPFLEIVAYPVALLAGLVVAAFAIGGIFGFPMMQAALATERNGTLDAVSRTFSYVFTRPVLYAFCVAVLGVVAVAISMFGGWFLDVSVRATTFGASWNADAASAVAAGSRFGASPLGLLGPPQVPSSFEGLALVWVYVSWLVAALAALAIHGYVLSYFVGGLADTYFILRREVDGIDDAEVYVEGAEPRLEGPLPNEPAPALEVR